MIIAIDGPTASGKGTVARRLAAHYGLPCLDTGLLYRGVAARLIREGDAPGDEDAAERAARSLKLKGMDESELRSARAGAAASVVAAMPRVRAALKDLQRDFAVQDGGAVLDGRDIGTVICPGADVKIWVDANPAERARRRHAELEGRGEDISYEEVLAQLRERDERDSGRPDAPMKRASDAHLLDTSKMSIDAAFEEARRIVDQVMAQRRA
ncbi:MAG: (d)CMP kinase [Euryhalocaulis sp.]|uniref:(d)CMP kinase n=1 Tax=Euryhalocaulis sp. TaxID=2744307 RepID=UPI00180013FE|nr:(d)CMP kinase [Euryhalocaulis sp.]MBA4802390.1 (d)CMP kinase [Euryhalocaulis sp.]